MKIDEIRAIVQLMSEHNLTEFKIEAEDMHLCIRRGLGQSSIHTSMTHGTTPVLVPSPVLAQDNQDKAHVVTASSSIEQQKDEKAVQRVTIDAPLVGTFYRNPNPNAESFVKVGSRVDASTVVCIIEAMKVMNEVKAEKAGVIKEILVENAKPVEFGQPLFVLE